MRFLPQKHLKVPCFCSFYLKKQVFFFKKFGFETLIFRPKES